MSVVQSEPQLLCILQRPPFCSLINCLFLAVSFCIVIVILSLVLFFLSIAGERKKYKSKSISFFFKSGNWSWHVIEVMKSLSVILNRHKARGTFLRFTFSSNSLNFEVSCLDLERSTISFISQDSSPVLTHSLAMAIAPVYIFE